MQDFSTFTNPNGVYLRAHRQERSRAFMPRVSWEVTDQSVVRISKVAVMHRFVAEGTVGKKVVSWSGNPSEGDSNMPWTGFTWFNHDRLSDDSEPWIITEFPNPARRVAAHAHTATRRSSKTPRHTSARSPGYSMLAVLSTYCQRKGWCPGDTE